jgi:cell division protein FtsW (lipid II flippase)
MANIIIEIIGWIGTAFILLAYFLLTNKKLSGESKTYHSMNLVGGVAIVINAVVNGAYPPAVLNVVWSLIAIYGIIKGLEFLKKKK